MSRDFLSMSEDGKGQKQERPKVDPKKEAEREKEKARIAAEEKAARDAIKREWRNKRDYYQMLGVSRGASERDIKKAFRTLAQIFHPDKLKVDARASAGERREAEESTAIFIQIKDAYELLVDPGRRALYDGFLAFGHDEAKERVKDQERGAREADQEERLRAEAREREDLRRKKQEFLYWYDEWSDARSARSVYSYIKEQLRRGKSLKAVTAEVEAALEEKFKLIPQDEALKARTKIFLEQALVRAHEEYQAEKAGRAGAAGGGADRGRERAAAEAEARRVFGGWVAEFFREGNPRGLAAEARKAFRAGYLLRDIETATVETVKEEIKNFSMDVGEWARLEAEIRRRVSDEYRRFLEEEVYVDEEDRRREGEARERARKDAEAREARERNRRTFRLWFEEDLRKETRGGLHEYVAGLFSSGKDLTFGLLQARGRIERKMNELDVPIPERAAIFERTEWEVREAWRPFERARAERERKAKEAERAAQEAKVAYEAEKQVFDTWFNPWMAYLDSATKTDYVAKGFSREQAKETLAKELQKNLAKFTRLSASDRAAYDVRLKSHVDAVYARAEREKGEARKAALENWIKQLEEYAYSEFKRGASYEGVVALIQKQAATTLSAAEQREYTPKAVKAAEVAWQKWSGERERASERHENDKHFEEWAEGELKKYLPETIRKNFAKTSEENAIFAAEARLRGGRVVGVTDATYKKCVRAATQLVKQIYAEMRGASGARAEKSESERKREKINIWLADLPRKVFIWLDGKHTEAQIRRVAGDMLASELEALPEAERKHFLDRAENIFGQAFFARQWMNGLPLFAGRYFMEGAKKDEVIATLRKDFGTQMATLGVKDEGEYRKRLEKVLEKIGQVHDETLGKKGTINDFFAKVRE